MREDKYILNELNRFLKSIDKANDVRQVLLSILESVLEISKNKKSLRKLSKDFDIDKRHKYHFIAKDFGVELFMDVDGDTFEILNGFEDYIHSLGKKGIELGMKLIDILRWVEKIYTSIEAVDIKDTRPINDPLNFDWSESTLSLFLRELPTYIKSLDIDLDYVKGFLADLTYDLKDMISTFGKNDSTVKEYKLAIKEIEEYIIKANALSGIPKWKKGGLNESMWSDQYKEAKIVLDELRRYLKSINSVNDIRHALLSILESGLEDANFHSEVRSLRNQFKIDKSHKYYYLTQDFGRELANDVKWDGTAILLGVEDYIFTSPRAMASKLMDIKRWIGKTFEMNERKGSKSVNEKMSEIQKLTKKARKLVDEINDLIEIAVDNDGDPLGVIDKTSIPEVPRKYKPIILNDKTGRLTITYTEYGTKGLQKDTILGRELEDFGLATLRDIRKQYKAGIKFFQKYGYSQ